MMGKGKAKENIKKSGNLPALKIMGGVVGVTTLIAAGMVFLGNESQDGLPNDIAGQSKQTNITPVSDKIHDKYVPGGVSTDDQHYRSLIKDYERQRMKEARKNKESYIPSPDLTNTNDDQLLQLKQKIASLKLALKQQKMESASYKSQIDSLSRSARQQAPTISYYELDDGTVLASSEMVRERTKRSTQMVTDILSEELVAQTKSVRISAKSNNRKSSSYGGKTYRDHGQGNNNVHTANANYVNLVSSSADKPSAISAGDMLYATLDMTANSDVPGPITATLHEGPYPESKLIGSFSKKGDYLVLTFTKMVLSDGTVKAIKGVAVDPVMMTVAQGDELDRHIGSKLAAVFGAAWLKGIGSAFLESGKIQSADGSGQYAIKESALDSAGKVAVAGLAEVGKSLGEMLRPYINRPDTVIKYANTDMAVLFLDTVK